MSFLSKLFRRSKPSLDGKIKKFLSQPSNLEPTLVRQVNLVFETKMEAILPETTPSWEAFYDSFATVQVSDLPISSWELIKDLSLGQFLSDDAADVFIEAMIQPSLIPNKDLIQRLFKQKEIGEIISSGLQKIITEINHKLNPLSSVFKSSGFESQMFKIINSFIPGIQESIANRIMHIASDSQASGIFKNTMRIVLEVKPSDFALPSEVILKNTQEKWMQFVNKLKNDSKFKSEFSKIADKLYSQFRTTSSNRMLKEFLFLTDDDYIKFRKLLTKQIALSMVNWDKETGILSKELNEFFTDIQNA